MRLASLLCGPYAQLCEGKDREMTEYAAFLKKLSKIREIPTLPEVMRDVLAAVASESSSAEYLAFILTRDQALCSKILKMANSAFFAQSRKIFDIKDAVVLLGFDSISQLMLSTTVFTFITNGRLHDRFDLYGFWKHSLATAVAGKIISEKIGNKDDENLAYTSGLLHDIGKLVLVNYFPDDYAPVLDKVEAEESFLYDAEMEVLGFTHCDISEWLCSRWNFPEKLIDLIVSHHAPLFSGDEIEAENMVVRLADMVCNRLEIGNSGNTMLYSISEVDFHPMGLDESNLDSIEQKMRKNEEEIDRVLNALT